MFIKIISDLLLSQNIIKVIFKEFLLFPGFYFEWILDTFFSTDHYYLNNVNIKI